MQNTNHHSHHHSHLSATNLKMAFFINLSFTIVEIAGGILTNSVAILSDAVHDLGDSVSLGLAWYLEKISRKTATEQFTFGYSRFSLLGALINALVLMTGSIYIISEAIERLQNPEISNAKGMIAFAILGIIANGYAAWKVSSGKSQNEKIISWHLIEDVLGWVAVLFGGIILYFKPITWLDPALSLAITAFILWNVFRNLKETIYIFLQAVPSNIKLGEIKNKICELPEVESMHHTHIWSLEGEHHVFSTHVKLKSLQTLEEMTSVKLKIKEILKKYPFSHYTVEVELNQEKCMMDENHDHESNG